MRGSLRKAKNSRGSIRPLLLHSNTAHNTAQRHTARTDLRQSAYAGVKCSPTGCLCDRCADSSSSLLKYRQKYINSLYRTASDSRQTDSRQGRWE